MEAVNYIAFEGDRRVASGGLRDVAAAAKAASRRLRSKK